MWSLTVPLLCLDRHKCPAIGDRLRLSSRGAIKGWQIDVPKGKYYLLFQITTSYSSFCTLLDFKLRISFRMNCFHLSHELLLPQALHSAYPMESFLGTVWRQSLSPFSKLWTGCRYAWYGAIHLPRNMFTYTSPHSVQNSTCTLPPSVPCFRCGRSYSTIVSLTDSNHMLLTAAQHSEFWWYHTIADGQLSLSQDTSCLPAAARHDSGSVISLASVGWRGFPEGVYQPYHHVFWAICEYPAMKCSAPRRQRAWLSVRLDSSLGFCLIHAPCFVWQPAGRQVAYLLYSLNRWPGRWLSA